jgi:hypothetical protein
MRSLDRRSMDSIFAPLDPNERLPRELLLERSRFHPFHGNTPWGRFASFLWIPFVLATVGLLVWWFGRG